MKEFLKNYWMLALAALSMIIFCAAVLIGAHKEAHAEFMVRNKCIIELKDLTLKRAGCLDAEQRVYWRVK